MFSITWLRLKRHLKSALVLLATCLTLLSGMRAMADDTEIFYGSSATASSPNIMLILDTSGSMNTAVNITVPYSASTTYSGTCNNANVYYSTSATTPTATSIKSDCSGYAYIDATKFYCSPATAWWGSSSSSSSSSSLGAFATTGHYSDYAIRWMTTTASSSSSTPAYTTTTTWKTTDTYYTTSSSSSKSSYSSSSSSSYPATGGGGSSATYAWQAAMSKSNSSSSASSTQASSTASSTSSAAASSLSSAVTSGGKTYVTMARTVTRTDSTPSRTTTSTSSTTYAPLDVTCYNDVPGIAGATPSSSAYPLSGNGSGNGDRWNGTSSSNYWKSLSGGAPSAANSVLYYFFTGNYLNYIASGASIIASTRLGIMKTAIAELLNSSSGINVGLMRYSNSGSGGMVIDPMGDIATNKNTIISDVNSWDADGNTPLTETLYEAYLYFAGKNVNFGNSSTIFISSSSSTSISGCTYSSSRGGYTCSKPSVAASRVSSSSNGSTYNSPMNYACQKNYVVYLTDGFPTSDTAANSSINALLSSASSSISSCSAGNNGACLSTLTTYMYQNDLRSSVADTQNVTSYFVGFGTDFSSGSSASSAFAYLKSAGTAGGGDAYSAGDLTELSGVFSKIFSSIKTDASTFTSPSVAVNAFNKTQVLEDLYFTMFQPSATYHWPGNVKKYKLRNSGVVDQNYAAAVDNNTGFFKSTAPDFWSTSPTNNNKVTVGGAANLIPVSSSRTVYTYIGSNPGSGSSFLTSMQDFSTANTAITSTLLGVSATSRDKLINWARGVDVDDVNGNGSTTDARLVMGDPIHSQPNIVIYGNSSSASTTVDKLNDAVVLTATNDGYLHAIDVATGVERWAFIPQDALSNLAALYNDEPGDTKHYILDGNLRVLKYDINGDGVVDAAAGDRVILYFSQGRGGSHYYALDITNKDSPQFMWEIGSESLPDIGKSWSTPTIGRVNINGATQNSQKLTLIFGGGYDNTEETASYTATDSAGRAIYMVDAIRGSVVWSGGYPGIATSGGTGASQSFAGMDHAISSDITIMDTNGDGYIDRMYVGDMAGQLWRFDITNGNAASSLVAGGVIASIGSHEESPHTMTNNRRFYNAPDVASFNPANGAAYFNIAIGSGYRGHPLNTQTADRFYAIRDYNPFTALSQASYNTYTKATDGTLTDISTNVYAVTIPTIPANTPGWKLALSSSGEKILSPSVTLNGTVLFDSYTPSASVVNCNPSSGTARSYAINVKDGTDRFSTAYETYTVAGLPAMTQIVDTSALVSTVSSSSSSSTSSGSSSSGSAGSGGSSSSSNSSSSSPGACLAGALSTDCSSTAICLKGTYVAGNCVDPAGRSKTYWMEGGAPEGNAPSP